jgi:hypothetical protein
MTTGGGSTTKSRAAIRKENAAKIREARAAKKKAADQEGSYSDAGSDGGSGSDVSVEPVSPSKRTRSPAKSKGKKGPAKKAKTNTQPKTAEELYLDKDPFPMKDVIKHARKAVEKDGANLTPMYGAKDTEDQRGALLYKMFYASNLSLPSIDPTSSFLQTQRVWKSIKRHSGLQDDKKDTRNTIFNKGWEAMASDVKSMTTTLVCLGMGYPIHSNTDRWSAALPPSHSEVLTKLFPPMVNLFQVAHDGLATPACPSTSQLKSAITGGNTYAAMKDHFLFTRLLAFPRKMKDAEEYGDYTSLRHSPELFAQMAMIALFTVFGSDLTVAIRRATAIAKGDSTFGKLPPLLFCHP